MNNLKNINSINILKSYHGALALFIAIAGIILSETLLSLVTQNLKLSNLTIWIFHIILSGILFAGAPYLILKYKKISYLSGVNLKKSSPVLIIIAAAGVIPAGILTDTLSHYLYKINPELFNVSSIETISNLLNSLNNLHFITLLLMLSVAAPVYEEIMFRGFLLNSFKNETGIIFTAILSSILFGIVHFNLLQGIAAGFLGLYLAFLTLRSKSILPAIAAHIVNNLTFSLFSVYEKESAREVLKSGYSYPVIALCMSALTIVIILFYRISKKQNN